MVFGNFFGATKKKKEKEIVCAGIKLQE